MPINREYLQRLKEAPLRTEIIIPLLIAMGFRDVVHHHGGTLEQGKDIVMWKPGELGERVNYAVVVKAGDINGRARGAGSAAEVSFQVRQCFGSPFCDSLTTEERQIDYCLVIASGTIIPAAHQSLNAALNSDGLLRTTRFIDGDHLQELVDRHLPEKTAWDQLGQAHKALQELVPNYQVSLRMDGKTTSLSLSIKEGSTVTEPPEITFHLNFGAFEDGNNALEQYLRFIRTGSAFKLGPEVILKTDMPQSFWKLFNFSDTAKLGFSFTPIALHTPFDTVRLEWVCTDGTRAALENLELVYVQEGTDELTISNEHQKVPWIVTLRVQRRTGAAKFACKANLVGINSKQALDWLRFAKALTKPGAFKAYSHVTGFESMTQQNNSPPLLSVEDAPSTGFVDMVEKLVAIQHRTNQMLSLPEQITDEEWDEIEYVHAAVTTGKVMLAPEDILFSGSVPRSAFRKNWQDLLKPGTLVMRSNVDDVREICGVKILLGPAVTVCERAQLVEPDVHAMFDDATEQTDNDDQRRVEYTLRAVHPDSKLWMEYPDWMPDRVPGFGPERVRSSGC